MNWLAYPPVKGSGANCLVVAALFLVVHTMPAHGQVLDSARQRKIRTDSIAKLVRLADTEIPTLTTDLNKHGFDKVTIESIGKLGVNNLREYSAKTRKGVTTIPTADHAKLKTLSFLSLLTDDPTVQDKFYKQNVKSLKDLKGLSDSRLTGLAGSDAKAKLLRLRIKAMDRLVLKELVAKASTMKTKALMSPAGTPGPPPGTSSGMAAMMAAPDGCITCGESKNLLSPAVYVLYLLDFVESSYGTRFNTLAKINQRFYSQFEDIPLSEDVGFTGSYVMFANDVLENYYASLNGSSWPNLRNNTSRVSQKSSIYSNFAATGFPHQNLMAEYFDAVVQEFGTSRKEVQLTLRGSTNYQANFRTRKGLTATDCSLIDKTDAAITYANVDDLKTHLKAFIERSLGPVIREEFIAEMDGQYRKEFSNLYKGLVRSETESLQNTMIGAIGFNPVTESDAYDNALTQAVGVARFCVETGLECPAGSTYDHNPLNALTTLFKTYAQYYPTFVAVSDRTAFARNRVQSLKKDTLEEKRFKDLVAEAHITLPIAASDPNKAEKEQVVADISVSAARYAGEAILSEEEFDRQFNILLHLVFKEQLATDAAFKASYDSELANRVKDELSKAISQAEKGYYVKLRANLIKLILNKLSALATPSITNEKQLADHLFMDLEVGEEYTTTSISLAITRIHTLVQSSRLGIVRVSGNAPDLIEPVAFNEKIWGYLKSYGTWHASMMVELYPENYLYPDLRSDMSPEFLALKDTLENGGNVDAVVNAFESQLNSFRWRNNIVTAKADHKLFVFRHDGRGVYYTTSDNDNEFTYWKSLDVIPPIYDYGSGGNKYFDHVIYDYWENPGSNDRQEYLRFFTWAEPGPDEYYPRLFYLSLPIKNGDLAPDGALEWEDIGVVLPDNSNIIATNSSGDKVIRTGWTVTHGVTMSSNWDHDFHKLYAYIIASFPMAGASQGARPFIYSINLQSDGTIAPPNLSGNLSLAQAQNSIWRDFIPEGQDSENSFIVHDDYTASTDYIFGGTFDAPIPYYIWEFDIAAPADNIIRKRQAVQKAAIGNIGGCPFGKNPRADLINYFFCNGGSITSVTYPITSANATISSVASGLAITTPLNVSRNYDGNFFFGKLGGKLGYYWKPFQRAISSDFFVLDMPEFCANCKPNLKLTQQPSTYDPLVRKYIMEYYLYMPLLVGNFLNENAQYEKALKYYSRIYDPRETVDPGDAILPDFLRERNEALPFGQWLENPFDPYAIANLHGDAYLLNVKFAIVGNILDWADKLFIQDSPETVNQSRELYEFASAILNLTKWPDEGCGSAEYNFFLGTLITADTPIQPTAEEEANMLELVSATTMGVVDEVGIGEEILEIKPFCLPVNPQFYLMKWRIESNLEKIRSNRNYAGVQRQLQLYATPVPPDKLVKMAASGDLDFDNIVPNAPPPVFKYSYLIERAKNLASGAQQFETSMLSSLEKLDEASYSYMKGQQDIKLEKTNVNLQTIMLKEANDSYKQAQSQLDKVDYTYSYYDDLIDEGLIGWEQAALVSQITANATFLVGATDFKNQAGAASAGGQALLAFAGIASTKASWDRRKEEWEFQRKMADYDKKISAIGIDLANDRIEIAAQEKSISELRLGFANDNLEFLSNKFTNKELYSWMSKNLRKLYQNQLNLGISMAKAAQNALEFELQTSLDFIGYDYWDPQKKGLLGAENLLLDIDQMESHRVSNATRRREITKTISLQSIDPGQFEQFRRTGLLNFETTGSLFDKDFPGHYLRLIKDVSVSVLALVPPMEGVHATLSNPGISRVMAGPPFEASSVIYRLPESIALSQATNATGLFELRPDDTMLLPFEGSGVETVWTLEMPKGANRFNFSSIADVLVTIRYTALEDRSYRKKILEEWGQDEIGNVRSSSNRYFSVANEFPDQWYALNNPVLGLNPSQYCDPFAVTYDLLEKTSKPLKTYSMVVDVRPSDFLPNETGRKIKKVSLALQTADNFFWDSSFELPLKVKFMPEKGFDVGVVNFSIDEVFDSKQNFNGKTPHGKWVIQIDTTDPNNKLLFPKAGVTIPDLSWLRDVIMVVEYSCDTNYNK